MYIACPLSKLCLLDNATEAGNTTSVGLKLMCPVSNHFDVPKCGQSWIIFFFLWHQQLQQNLPFSCQDLAPSNLYGRADSSFSSGSNNALARQMNGETDKWQIYNIFIIFHLTYWLLLLKKLNMII